MRLFSWSIFSLLRGEIVCKVTHILWTLNSRFDWSFVSLLFQFLPVDVFEEFMTFQVFRIAHRAQSFRWRFFEKFQNQVLCTTADLQWEMSVNIDEMYSK